MPGECRENAGYGDVIWRAASGSLPQLAEVYRTVRPNGPKEVTREWVRQVTTEGLAWWFMDDGSVSRSSNGTPYVSLHTEGFGREEQTILQDWLQDLGYATKVSEYGRNDRTWWHLRMPKEASGKWLDAVSPYVVPCMRYKVEPAGPAP